MLANSCRAAQSPNWDVLPMRETTREATLLTKMKDFMRSCSIGKEVPMWERLRSIWTVPDLRNKILFTLGMLLVFRILAHITVPLSSAEQQALVNLFTQNNNANLGQLLGL